MAIRSTAMGLLLPVLLTAHAALAQTQSADSDTSSTTPQRTTEASAASDARSRADEDARTCLDFVTNIGVIRCAEKYRLHKDQAERRGKR